MMNFLIYLARAATVNSLAAAPAPCPAAQVPSSIAEHCCPRALPARDIHLVLLLQHVDGLRRPLRMLQLRPKFGEVA